MESIDLELGELFDRDAVDVDDEVEDVATHASGYGEDEEPADGVEGWYNGSGLKPGPARENAAE